MFHSIKLSGRKVHKEVLLLYVSCQNYLFEVIELFALIMCKGSSGEAGFLGIVFVFVHVHLLFGP